MNQLKEEYKQLQNKRFYALNKEKYENTYRKKNPTDELVKINRQIKELNKQSKKSPKTTNELVKLLKLRNDLYLKQTEKLLEDKKKLDLLSENKLMDAKGSIVKIDEKIIDCDYIKKCESLEDKLIKKCEQKEANLIPNYRTKLANIIEIVKYYHGQTKTKPNVWNVRKADLDLLAFIIDSSNLFETEKIVDVFKNKLNFDSDEEEDTELDYSDESSSD